MQQLWQSEVLRVRMNAHHSLQNTQVLINIEIATCLPCFRLRVDFIYELSNAANWQQREIIELVYVGILLFLDLLRQITDDDTPQRLSSLQGE